MSAIYMPTAMTPARAPNTTYLELENYRERTNVFMRGYSERIYFNVTDGRPWMWRRICFTSKGREITNASLGSDGLFAELVPQGYTRPFVRSNTAIADALSSYVMKGVEGRDWNNIMDAKSDNTRVDIKYDVTRTINPGSTQGKMVKHKLWHPMNKNFIYNDDEAGSDELIAHFHTNAKPGMGDYYIWDIIRASTSDAAPMGVSVQGTLYWHER